MSKISRFFPGLIFLGKSKHLPRKLSGFQTERHPRSLRAAEFLFQFAEVHFDEEIGTDRTCHACAKGIKDKPALMRLRQEMTMNLNGWHDDCAWAVGPVSPTC
jgi:hypothetical protein